MPVIVAISDADSHRMSPDPGACNGVNDDYTGTVATVAHSLPLTETALNTICARFVGIAPIGNATCSAVNYYTALGTTSGSRVPPAAWDVGTRPTGCAATQCCTGQNGVGQATDVDGLCPLVFLASTSGTGVSTSVVTGIQMLTRFATFTASTMKSGGTTDNMNNPLPAGHTTADFITAITPASFTLPPPPPNLPNPTFDATLVLRCHARHEGRLQRRRDEHVRAADRPGADLHGEHHGARQRLHAARSAHRDHPRAADRHPDPVGRHTAAVEARAAATATSSFRVTPT